MLRHCMILGAVAVATSFASAPAAALADDCSSAGAYTGAADVAVSVPYAPPPLPDYTQPAAPAPNMIWTPGSWAYGNYGYYWVPGTWVAPPAVGYLWTPGYWGYGGFAYGWHPGYWGIQVGFYGGIDYGFGYFGGGYEGGRWNRRNFEYDTAYTNVNRRFVHDVYYNRIVVNNYYGRGAFERVSYNGSGGVRRRPTAAELAFMHRTHLPETAVQRQHVLIASDNRNYLAAVNHGHPGNLAVAKPLDRENRPADFASISTPRAAYGPGLAHEPAATRSAAATYRSGAEHRPANVYRDAASRHAAYRAAAVYHPVHSARPATYHAASGRSASSYRPTATHDAAASHRPGAATYRPAVNHPATTYRPRATRAAAPNRAAAYHPAATRRFAAANRSARSHPASYRRAAPRLSAAPR